ncbi:MAG TPA: Spy/CpxP family protein refolding chaperone [Blastocatellia bacterium]|nr:Spy/CpxP family protein refolding chaperone [Blastocatellia bacterium]
MSKRVIGYISGFALVIALVFGVVLAQNGQSNNPQQHPGKAGKGRFGKGHRGMGMAFRQLNLTDQQKAQIKDIFQNQRASNKPLFDQLKTERQALRAASTSANFNEDAVRTAAQNLAKTRADLMVARVETMRKAYAVLTPDQQAKLKELRAERVERFKEKKAGAGSSASNS